MGQPAHVWQCGDYRFSLAEPLVMGILNVTPDSFSDGGRYTDIDQACHYAHRMVEEGAHIIDVGGESTRPGASEISPAEELARVLPVVERLAQADLVVSVDTRHVEVAHACVQAGASIINDVSGFRDPRMVELATACRVGLVVMHMQGEPHTMQSAPTYRDVVAEVRSYLCSQAHMLEAAGVAPERICLDPGIGFGKTNEHNLALLRATPQFAELGWPLMVAVSRKRLVAHLTGVEKPAERVAGSVTLAVWALQHGATIARVHDVAETVQALKTFAALA